MGTIVLTPGQLFKIKRPEGMKAEVACDCGSGIFKLIRSPANEYPGRAHLICNSCNKKWTCFLNYLIRIPTKT